VEGFRESLPIKELEVVTDAVESCSSSIFSGRSLRPRALGQKARIRKGFAAFLSLEVILAGNDQFIARLAGS
jgi:hypothetical protein